MVKDENISGPIEAGNKADSEAVENSVLSSKGAGNEAVEKLGLNSKEAKDLAESLLKKGYATNVVADKTGLPAEVVRGLKGSLVKKTKKFEEEVAKAKTIDEEKRERVKGEEKELLKQEEKKPLIPYAEVEPADVFLRNFLSEFDFKEQFIDLLCRRVKRRNALPYPNDLAADIQDMASGITNPKSANYIAEEYSYVLKDYEKRLKSTNKLRGSMGYDIGSPDNIGHDGSQGISLDRYKGDDGQVRDFRRGGEKGKEKTPVDPIKEVLKKHRAQKAERLEDLMETKEIANAEKELGGGEGEEEEKKHTLVVDGVSLKLTTEEMLSWKHYLAEEKRAEEEREERKEERKERQRLIDERYSENDGGLVEWVIGEGSNARTIKVRPETIPFLVQAQGAKNPSQNPGLDREEVAQMVERTIEARTKNLTTDDVEKIVQHSMGDRVALTKGDLLYMESRDKLHLEEKKLDESGKTRDVIGNAIRDGFGHAGRIVSRMMTGEGETTGMPVEGYTDQAGNMMQVACLSCNAVITAPVGSPAVICPKCGKRWTVERVEQPSYEPPKKVEEKKPPVEEFVPGAKKIIEKSVEDTKEGEIKSSETSDAPAIIPEQATDAPKVMPEQTTDAPKVMPEQTTDAPKTTPKPETVAPDVAYEPLTVDAPKDISEPGTIDVPKDVEKIAENIAVGEATDYLEEELKKKKELEEKPARKKRCPVCKKPFKNRRAVASHIVQKHPEYKK